MALAVNCLDTEATSKIELVEIGISQSRLANPALFEYVSLPRSMMPKLQPGSPGDMKAKSELMLSSKSVEEVIDWL